MSSLFSLCLGLLTTLSVAIILSLRESPPQHTVIQQYLTNYTILSTIIEEQAQRNITNNKVRKRKKHILEKKNEKFDKMIKQMKKEKKVSDNKYFRRNKRIQDIFGKRLGKIKEYCARYKKGQKRGIRGIKPRAATKSFSLGDSLDI